MSKEMFRQIARERLHRHAREAEDLHIPGPQISHGGGISGGASNSLTWAEIVRIPSYATYDSYIVLPESDKTAIWVNGHADYEVATVVKGNSNHRLYACYQKSGSGTHDPETDTDNSHWILSTETEIDHVLGFDGAQDMRDFVPWLEVGTFVPYIEKESIKYLDVGFVPVGVSGNRSMMWDATDNRAMAVWK